MSFRGPKPWWILRLLPQGVYTVSIKLHIRAKKVINVSSTNVVGDTSTLILSRETQLAPSTRNTFPIKKKKNKVPKGKSHITNAPMSLDWINSPIVPHWQLSSGRAQCGAEQWLSRRSTSRHLTDSWWLIGRAERYTIQLLGKTCCLVTGCGVIWQSNGYLLMAVHMLLCSIRIRWVQCFLIFLRVLSHLRFLFHMLVYLLYIILFIVFPGMPFSTAYLYAPPTFSTWFHVPHLF